MWQAKQIFTHLIVVCNNESDSDWKTKTEHVRSKYFIWFISFFILFILYIHRKMICYNEKIFLILNCIADILPIINTQNSFEFLYTCLSYSEEIFAKSIFYFYIIEFRYLTTQQLWNSLMYFEQDVSFV